MGDAFESLSQSLLKTFQKNIKKPLDKRHTMCYNIRAVRGERTAPQAANKKFFMKG